MELWQWILLAIPAIVLLVSIVMITKILLGGTQDPGQESAAVEPAAETVPERAADPEEQAPDAPPVSDHGEPEHHDEPSPFQRPVDADVPHLASDEQDVDHESAEGESLQSDGHDVFASDDPDGEDDDEGDPASPVAQRAQA